MISASEDGLPEDSVALAFQLRAIQSRHSRQKSERSRKMNSMSWNSQPTKPSVGSNPVKMLVPALPPDARIAQVGIQSCYRRTSGPTAFAEPASPLAGPTDPASSECHTQNTPNTASLGNRKIVHLHHPACGKIFPVVRYHKRQGVSHVVLKLSDSQTQTLPLDWTSVRPELPPQPARSFFHIQDLLSLVELTHKLRRKDP